MRRRGADGAVLILALVAAACTGPPSRMVASSKPSAQGTVGQGADSTPIQVRPGSSLAAIDGSGRSDVWTVGEQHGSSIESHSLVAHWDGTAWGLVSVPDIGPLVAVVATAPNDAWALGGRNLLHWDGAAWSTKGLPRGSYSALSATGPTDVWIAGVQPGPMIGKNSRGWSSAVAHYDGGQWRIMRTPNPGTRDNYVEGIVARSPDDVWAGGYFVNLGKHVLEATSLTMHWDGKTWSVVRSPNPSPSLDVLWSMGQDEAGGVWALGQYRGSDHHLHTLVLRWSGQGWAIVPIRGTSLWSAQAVGGSASGPTWVVGSPATSSFAIARCNAIGCDTVVRASQLQGSAWSVYSASSDDAWAVGVAWGQGAAPLVDHWNGSAWTTAAFAPVPMLP
jgi:hypothetical protein